MNRRKWGLIAALVWGFGEVVQAAETKIEGLLFGGYNGYLSEFKSDGTGANDFNAFAINRVYVIGSTVFSERMYGKVILEANALTAGNAVFLKAAYVEWKEVFGGVTIAAGMPLTPWRGFEEGMWKFRFVEKIQEDIEGLLKPSDNGVKCSYVLPDTYGVAEVMISNGEGFSSIEVSRDKDVQARVTVMPWPETLKELSVSVFGLYGKANTDRRRERVMALIGYDSPAWTVAGSCIAAWDQAAANGGVTTQVGFSMYGTAALFGSWSTLGRVDLFDPQADTLGDRHTRTIVGFAYDCGHGVKLAVTDHLLLQEAETPARKNQHLVQINMVAKW